MLVEDDAESSSNNKSFVADQDQIYRDRSTFTKHLIKCFFKITLQRASTKMGSPWCVKREYLQMYGLTMDWPADMLKYKEDEVPLQILVPPDTISTKSTSATDDAAISNAGSNMVENVKSKKDKNKKRDDNLDETDIEMDNETQAPKPKRRRKNKVKEEESALDDQSGNTTKETNTFKKEESPTGTASTTHQPTPVSITSIMDDLLLPYQGPPPSFLQNLTYYNKNLECLPVTLHEVNNGVNSKFKRFYDFQKVLQVYQFINNFNNKLYISYFNLDEFITSLKCTDPYELKGEIVKVSLKSHESDSKGDNAISTEDDWQRNPKMRDMIRSRESEDISYIIQKDDPASDDVLDDFNNNGSALIIECFVSLIRLFVDEDGESTCVIIDDWLTDENDENEEEEEENSLLEKVLNYRNVNWVERLMKRQFNNGYWLIILLGILQDSSRIPKYGSFIKSFSSKIIPNDVSSTQLQKQLWRNFCRKLSLQDKLEACLLYTSRCV